MVLSKLIMCYPFPLNAKFELFIAFIAAMQFLSIQGIYTNPKIGSQVKPKLCSNPMFAALQI